MGSLINDVVKIGTLGLVDDVTGMDAAADAQRGAANALQNNIQVGLDRSQQAGQGIQDTFNQGQQASIANLMQGMNSINSGYGGAINQFGQQAGLFGPAASQMQAQAGFTNPAAQNLQNQAGYTQGMLANMSGQAGFANDAAQRLRGQSGFLDPAAQSLQAQSQYLDPSLQRMSGQANYLDPASQQLSDQASMFGQAADMLQQGGTAAGRGQNLQEILNDPNLQGVFDAVEDRTQKQLSSLQARRSGAGAQMNNDALLDRALQLEGDQYARQGSLAGMGSQANDRLLSMANQANTGLINSGNQANNSLINLGNQANNNLLSYGQNAGNNVLNAGINANNNLLNFGQSANNNLFNSGMQGIGSIAQLFANKGNQQGNMFQNLAAQNFAGGSGLSQIQQQQLANELNLIGQQGQAQAAGITGPAMTRLSTNQGVMNAAGGLGGALLGNPSFLSA
jgi:hypothetical protein